MKILSAEQIRKADAFTILNEPISSLSLMERAGKSCYNWIVNNTDTAKRYVVVCGTGNNGGDGLVIARLLAGKKMDVDVIILSSSAPSEDFKKKLEELKLLPFEVKELKEGEKLSLEKNIIIIDAVFGTGLNRPVARWLADCIDEMNNSGNEIISIDLPSGLFADAHSDGKVICAKHTLTFQCPKLAFYFPENEKYTGEFHVLDIKLDKKFINGIDSAKIFLKNEDIKKLLKPRRKFSHKGNFGKSLLICGSKGKMGAAVLAARACLRSGTGLLTVHIPGYGYLIMQTSVPEAMVETDMNEEMITCINNADDFDSIGIGPGIGKQEGSKKMFFELLEKISKSIVVDADALNLLSENKDHLKKLPANSILTPHLKEFERLAGKSENDFDRHEKQLRFSKENNVIVILKGAYTCITTPDGKAYFNSTGNPGMAKGGSGDALTGMITAFLAQHYIPEHAALLAVYLHGLAGDIAAEKKGMHSMICSDLIESIPKAFRLIVD